LRRLLLSLLVFISFGAGRADAAPSLVVVSVPDIACSSCAEALTAAFARNEAVEAVKVDVEKKEVTLELKSGMRLSDGEIRDLVSTAGYRAEGIFPSPQH
jgi:copper chaperone CopZ